MIRCYYTKETIDRVAKARRYRAIGCGSLFCGLPVLLMILKLIEEINNNPGVLFHDRVLFLLGIIVAWVGGCYFFHWQLCKIERTTLKHAGDEITLDDNEIRLVKSDGTRITFPRDGLKIFQASPYVAGSMSFRIRNPTISHWDEIILTSHMENAKELVETIQPGSWDEGE